MNYYNLELRVLDEEAFGVASRPDIGVWLLLSAYCARRENFGVIESCLDWPERLWIKAVGIDKAEVNADSTLWRWSGDNLHVHFYPKKQQETAAHLRAISKSAAKIRWKKIRQKQDDSCRNLCREASRSAMRKDKGKDKGNGNLSPVIYR